MYRPCEQCEEDCYAFESRLNMHATKAGPCWGQVECIDEMDYGDGDSVWIHACQGHTDMWSGGKYRPESTNV